MFGLTFEKLFLVAVVAGVLIGPQRLPAYAHQLRETVRGFRAFVEASRARARAEVGDVLTRAEWEALDLRQYDPRRIVRDALDGAPTSAPTSAPTGAGGDRPVDAAARAELVEQASRVRPGQRFLVTGSAAHPRRVAIASLPADDPRRLAAQAPAARSAAEVAEGSAPERD
ncbi:Sec-independent protein translocase subunit TatA/TatB [Nocardioides zeae]|uniref:Preprotein translocase n=1 Tax=Nocardioides zeae TaxID=1457234 RepID=A0A6P0HFK0_9ACTN|nr:preprotein translocase [Nocardioides zeae]NEN77371.1 preprotein translocase [Nocardioides zeae]